MNKTTLIVMAVIGVALVCATGVFSTKENYVATANAHQSKIEKALEDAQK